MARYRTPSTPGLPPYIKLGGQPFKLHVDPQDQQDVNVLITEESSEQSWAGHILERVSSMFMIDEDGDEHSIIKVDDRKKKEALRKIFFDMLQPPFETLKYQFTAPDHLDQLDVPEYGRAEPFAGSALVLRSSTRVMGNLWVGTFILRERNRIHFHRVTPEEYVVKVATREDREAVEGITQALCTLHSRLHTAKNRAVKPISAQDQQILRDFETQLSAMHSNSPVCEDFHFASIAPDGTVRFEQRTQHKAGSVLRLEQGQIICSGPTTKSGDGELFMHVVLRVTAVDPAATAKVTLLVGDAERLARFNVHPNINGSYTTEIVFSGAAGNIQVKTSWPNVNPAATSVSVCVMHGSSRS